MAEQETRYLSVLQVIGLHAVIMEQTGFPIAPLREEGLLESAVLRPQTAAYYEHADLARQAAVLAVGIAQAQAFLDGNKRVAFGAMDVLLRLNGVAFVGQKDDAVHQFEALATRTDSQEAATARFEAWLRRNTGPLESASGAADEG
jgi:death on curing protein